MDTNMIEYLPGKGVNPAHIVKIDTGTCILYKQGDESGLDYDRLDLTKPFEIDEKFYIAYIYLDRKVHNISVIAVTGEAAESFLNKMGILGRPRFIPDVYKGAANA